VSTEPDTLRIQIDEASVEAGMAVSHALGEALRDVGLRNWISANHVAPERPATEYRSGRTLAAAAAVYVVYELRVYLTARLLNEAGDGLIDALERRLREWLHRTGNTIEVPIIGPDGETVLRTVRRQVDGPGSPPE